MKFHLAPNQYENDKYNLNSVSLFKIKRLFLSAYAACILTAKQ